MLSQDPEQLLVLNLFGGVFVAGLSGGGRFKQIKECAPQRQAAVGSEIQESLSKLKGRRH